MGLTYGELRRLLAEERLGWTTDPEAPDERSLPRMAMGASQEGLVETEKAEPFDFESLGVSPNPHLSIRRIARGLLSEEAATEALSRTRLLQAGLADVSPGGEGPPPEEAGTHPTAVDWRARWGQNWITTIRDQNPCEACWAFAGVALVESMLKIEHAMWARLSEGDVERGVGKTCPDTGGEAEVSDYFKDKGFCDPGCWPWSTDTGPYTPTSDRSGRTVRGPAFDLVSVADSRDWLDTVGPLAVWLEVYGDFFGLRGTTVYRRGTAPSNKLEGTHFMLIVGYDDSLGAWLCKNSWGTGWGDGGFGWVAYGETGIDTYSRYGVRNLNPDPWTKRRLHNGNLYESGNGALHRNLEVVGSNGSRVQHRWREGGPPFNWGTAASFANDAAVCPTLVGTTYDRNMEVVYTTTGGRLHHWWTEGGGAGPWHDGGVFGPSGCHSVPGFVQSDYGAPGNFEVVVAVGGGRLQHAWRDGGGWHNGPVFGSDIAFSGATLIQGDYGSRHPNLECVAVCTDQTMQHYWREESSGVWRTGPSFGAGVSSPPVMVQGQYGMRDESGPHGNFELCVAVGGRVQHWWRNNSGDEHWHHSTDFGHDVLAVAGLCESSWGMNLEVIVLRTDGQLQHYWRGGSTWHEGPVIGPA